MWVKMIAKTQLGNALFAALTCTDNVGKMVEDLVLADWDSGYMTTDNGVKFLKDLIKKGHESVLEHVVYTFNITGATRALLQELARHRHVSLSVKSTRWTLSKSRVDVALPDGVGEFPELVEAFNEYMEKVKDTIAENKGNNDILKYFLPECVTTNIVMTTNLRELRHIYKLRTGTTVLPEFKELMHKIVKEVPPVHKELITFEA